MNGVTTPPGCKGAGVASRFISRLASRVLGFRAWGLPSTADVSLSKFGGGFGFSNLGFRLASVRIKCSGFRLAASERFQGSMAGILASSLNPNPKGCCEPDCDSVDMLHCAE